MSQSFDQHWKKNQQKAIPPFKKKIAQAFLTPILSRLGGEPLCILDAGCGNGVHGQVLAEMIHSRSTMVGVDISIEALKQSQQLVGENWKTTQADLCYLPFADNSFDAVFCFGVLYYTQDPQKAFDELVRVTKIGGVLGIWVSPKPQGLTGKLWQFLRYICQQWPLFFTRMVADCIVPFLALLPTRSQMHLGNSTWANCREVVLVNLAPASLRYPTYDEVRQLFVQAGLEIFDEDKEQPVTIWAKKKQ